MTTTQIDWKAACSVQDIPLEGGACVLIEDQQIAIFRYSETEWFATQNLCPHKQQMALSRGMIGSAGEEPKVACPFHKKTFSLKSGNCLSGDAFSIQTYPVKVEKDSVFIGL